MKIVDRDNAYFPVATHHRAIVSESTAAHMAGLLEVLVEDRGIELVWDAIRLITIRTQGNILRALAC